MQRPARDDGRLFGALNTPSTRWAIDVEPIVTDEEIQDRLELLCQAVMCVCIGVNQMLGGTGGGGALNGLADGYVALSNKSVSKIA